MKKINSALNQFSKLIAIILLISCATEKEQEIDYEKEFYSIVNEFEKSSILEFDASEYIDDKFFLSFIEKIDEQKLIFLQSDINSLQDESFKSDSSQYKKIRRIVNLYYDRYTDSLKKRKRFLRWHKFNFDTVEYIDLNVRSDFFNDEDEKDEYQRKIVKNEILNLLLTGSEIKEAKKELIELYNDRISSLSKIRESDKFGFMANSLLSMLDPHASYFSDRDLENWNLRMNLSFEGIGAILSYESERARIQELMPGGPAINSNEIEVGDKILKVGQGKSGKLKNVIGWRLDDIVQLIRGEEGTIVRLEIENKSEKKVVSLVRGKVPLEESDASDEVIEINNKKLGYIKLPSFYSDVECLRSNVYICKTATSDVHKALRNFNYDEVEGLVIDLRNNGGGYLHEADSLTRLFIDYGPTVQVKNPDRDVEILNSWRSARVWSKPLVVLVNNYSASASEIFAGAMQDYNRGIIIGQTTFGKGSVQKFITTEYGQVKLTDSLYYRVSGQPTQLYGVTPNLQIPTLLDEDNYGERKYKNALKPAFIQNTYYVQYQDLEPVSFFESFEERINESKYFQKIAKIRQTRDSQLKLSLNYEARTELQMKERENTLELVNFGRELIGKEVFESYEQYQSSVKKEEFFIDAEIDQSLKVLSEMLEQKI
tara:strand:+ start:112 stop:2079 length:1968 start_codon:yes stop_codon:yes gene_type:complete